MGRPATRTFRDRFKGRTFEPDRWQHVAVTYDRNAGGLFHFYHDGVPVSHIANTAGWQRDQPVPGAVLSLDAGLALTGGADPVDLDEVVLWPRVLSPDEIAELAVSPLPLGTVESVDIDAGGQMYGLEVSWPADPGLDGLVAVEVTTGPAGDAAPTWCRLENGASLHPFGPCALMDNFRFRALLDGPIDAPGLDEVRFDWSLVNGGPPQILNHQSYAEDSAYATRRVELETHEIAVAQLRLPAEGPALHTLEAGPDQVFSFRVDRLAPDTEYAYTITVTDAFGAETTERHSFQTGPRTEAQIHISDEQLAGQAQNKRVGWGFHPTSGHWIRSLEQNFMENGGFEHGREVEPGIELGLTWASWSSWSADAVFTAALDDETQVSGLFSQRLNLADVPRMRLREYILTPLLEGHTYVIGCQMKAQDFDGSVQFRLNKPGHCAFDSDPVVDISTDWSAVSFEFTPESDCSSTVYSIHTDIVVSGSGTLWLDDCDFYDASDRDPDGLSREMLQRGYQTRPGTIRLGGLGLNTVRFENIVGTRHSVRPLVNCRTGEEKPSTMVTLNGLFRFAERLHSGIQMVIPWVFSDDDVTHMMEYLFGPPDTPFGANPYETEGCPGGPNIVDVDDLDADRH